MQKEGMQSICTSHAKIQSLTLRKRSKCICMAKSHLHDRTYMQHAGLRVAKQWRKQLESELTKSMPRIDVLYASLLIAAEHDALTDAACIAPLPVNAWMDRVYRIASELAQVLPTNGRPLQAEQSLHTILDHLYNVHGFTIVNDISSLPAGETLEHPGAWIATSHAYLHKCLGTRVCSPASFSILASAVVRCLGERGVVNYALAFANGCSDEPMPVSGGQSVNAVPVSLLVDNLKVLKLGFFPFAFDVPQEPSLADPCFSANGFCYAASQKLVGGEAAGGAEKLAIDRAARHRQDRGISGATGAGDLSRCIHAMEALLLALEASPDTDDVEHGLESRDLGVLYANAGRHGDAATHLEAYFQNDAAVAASSAAAVDMARRVLEICQTSTDSSTEVAPRATSEDTLVPIPW